MKLSRFFKPGFWKRQLAMGKRLNENWDEMTPVICTCGKPECPRYYAVFQDGRDPIPLSRKSYEVLRVAKR